MKKKSIEDKIPEFESLQEELDYIIACYPSLAFYRDDLSGYFLSNLTEIMTKYEGRAEWRRKIRERGFERQRRRRTRNSSKLVNEPEQALPEPGNKKKEFSGLIAQQFKTFWTETMGHKKFYYGTASPDDAKEFVDFILRVVFKENNHIVARSSFRKLSDPRQKKRRSKTEK